MAGAATSRRPAKSVSRASALAAGALVALLALGPGPARAAGPIGVLDGRAWELVSPLEKNGGNVAAPSPGGGAFAAAVAGGSLTYSSPASFGEAAGAPPLSQYLTARSGSGWASANISPPLLSGTYASGAYQLFSADLSRAVLSNGWQCHEGSPPCEAENPPLGSGALPGYRNLYLREGGKYTPLLSTTNYTPTAAAVDFELSLQGANPDLTHIVLAVEGLLHEWSAGQLTLLDPTPGASLAAPAGAISKDGSRIYFTAAGNLHLHQATSSVQIDAGQGGGGTFQAASADGRYAFFTVAEHLYRYDASTQVATDLTPGGGVQGVLAVSAAGDHVYFQDASALRVWRNGTTSQIASGAGVAAASGYPPATGTARLSADGTKLLFLSTTNPTNRKNAGATQELHRYDAASGQLLCISCNPLGAVPLGPASVPAAQSAAEGPAAYKPRALSSDGNRAFFDSADKLVSVDTNKAPDVYQWLAQGTAGCATSGGCLGLISGGRIGAASFLDASADGTDAFFLTATSLLPFDPGATDVYDARSGGGFPEAPLTIPCNGDDCQGPPSEPNDPIPGTATFEGPPNPPVHYPKVKKHSKHHKKKKKAKRHSTKKHQAGRGGRR